MGGPVSGVKWQLSQLWAKRKLLIRKNSRFQGFQRILLIRKHLCKRYLLTGYFTNNNWYWYYRSVLVLTIIQFRNL